jgi:hypothetical protein
MNNFLNVSLLLLLISWLKVSLKDKETWMLLSNSICSYSWLLTKIEDSFLQKLTANKRVLSFSMFRKTNLAPPTTLATSPYKHNIQVSPLKILVNFYFEDSFSFVVLLQISMFHLNFDVMFQISTLCFSFDVCFFQISMFCLNFNPPFQSCWGSRFIAVRAQVWHSEDLSRQKGRHCHHREQHQANFQSN